MSEAHMKCSYCLAGAYTRQTNTNSTRNTKHIYMVPTPQATSLDYNHGPWSEVKVLGIQHYKIYVERF